MQRRLTKANFTFIAQNKMGPPGEISAVLFFTPVSEPQPTNWFSQLSAHGVQKDSSATGMNGVIGGQT